MRPAELRLALAIGFSLTGEHAEPDQSNDLEEVLAQGMDSDTSLAELIVAWLDARGWDRDRMHQIRSVRHDDEQAWPFALPAELTPGLPWGQFAAVLQQTRDLLGVGTRVMPRTQKFTPPSAGDQRYLHDVPPHHGAW